MKITFCKMWIKQDIVIFKSVSTRIQFNGQTDTCFFWTYTHIQNLMPGTCSEKLGHKHIYHCYINFSSNNSSVQNNSSPM